MKPTTSTPRTCEYCEEPGSEVYKDGLCIDCYNYLRDLHADDDTPRRGPI